MINYKTWKTLNESMIGGTSILGFGSQNSIGIMSDNGFATTDTTSEAGKMLQPVDDMEPEEDDDGDMDDSEDDGEDDDGEDTDMDEKPKKKSKKKCPCDCDCEKCSKEDTKEESAGLDTYFCGCANQGSDGSMCPVCNKYTLKESYNPGEVIDIALNHYCGDDSNLYHFASLASKNYKPNKQLCESAKVEVSKLFKKANKKSRYDLAVLYNQLGTIHG